MTTEPKLTGTFVVKDAGFSKTVNERYDCGNGIILTRQVYMDYSYTIGEDDGKVISADSFADAVAKAIAYHEKTVCK